MPDLEEHWLHKFEQVIKTGQATRFNHYLAGLDRWFTMYATRLGDENSRQLALVFNDITSQKKAEETLRQSEEQKTFLLKLSDVLRSIQDPVKIQEVAAQAALDYFKADRCYYCEIQGDKSIIRQDAFRGNLPSVSGTYALSSFPIFKAVLQKKQPFVMPDVHTTNLLDDDLKQLCCQLKVISFIDIPVVKSGKPVGILCITNCNPRNWTNSEVDLAEVLAERTWAAVERARAEEDLRQSEARFRLMADAVPQAIWLTDAQGQVEFINKWWTDYAGAPFKPTSVAEITSRFVHPEDAPKVEAAFQKAQQTGKGFEVEQRNLSANGAYRWFINRGEPYRNPQTGQIENWVGTSVDIHDRKQAEEAVRRTGEQLRNFNTLLEQQVTERTQALKENRDRLQSVFDTTLLSMSILEAVRNENGDITDFKIKFVNKEFEQVTGRTDLLGKFLIEEFPGVSTSGLYTAMLRVIETGKPDQMEYFYPFDGFNNWYSAMFVKLNDGLVLSNLDITERKLAEAELVKNLTLLQQTEELVGLGSWEFNPENAEFKWSEGMYRLFRVKCGTPVQLETYLDYVVTKDRPKAEKIIRLIRQKADSFEETLRFNINDHTQTLKVKGIAVKDEAGVTVKMLGLILNITEIKNLEEENLVLRLQQQKDLLLAILEAQEEERRRISESLHNGVAQILYAAQLSLEQAVSATIPATRAELKSILNKSENLIKDAIRETRQASHELVPLLLQEFGLDAAMKNFCERFSHTGLNLSCIGLEQRLEKHLELAIYRITQELVNNIAKHSGATRGRVELFREGESLIIEAQDNGKGLNLNTTHRKGIGLKTIRDRVNLLGGTLSIESELGRGTLITIILPMQTPRITNLE
ncbi:PAS domain S-box protein [Adhaeribacter swui]|uniref:Oxygen sensor histidine kinase NreB n=1 Tax=Adhaeribacter swui TaxID=2086471 RepID=A0A7G7GBG2_9BACT|nr:PAS domain S-box protein [Adhaeribacter swui]QNF34496.1 PAS domain S-box protein [Adhaeribacter swui]